MNRPQIIKKVVANILFYSGAISLFRLIFPNRNPVILMYHQVEESSFSKQMAYLKKHFNIISLNELVRKLKNKEKFANNTIVITFDDAYKNNYTNAYPSLRNYGVPATVFVITSLIGTKNFAWWDAIEYAIEHTNQNKLTFKFDRKIVHLNLSSESEKFNAITILHDFISKYNFDVRKKALAKLHKELRVKIKKSATGKYTFMNWKQVEELSRNKINIGSHTVTHPFLSNIEKEEARRELIDSKKMIEKRINNRVDAFCYPSGDMDYEVKRLAKESGYTHACGVGTGAITRNSDIYELERVGINIKDNLAVFALKLSPLWEFFARKAIWVKKFL